MKMATEIMDILKCQEHSWINAGTFQGKMMRKCVVCGWPEEAKKYQSNEYEGMAITEKYCFSIDSYLKAYGCKNDQ